MNNQVLNWTCAIC